MWQTVHVGNTTRVTRAIRVIRVVRGGFQEVLEMVQHSHHVFASTQIFIYIYIKVIQVNQGCLLNCIALISYTITLRSLLNMAGLLRDLEMSVIGSVILNLAIMLFYHKKNHVKTLVTKPYFDRERERERPAVGLESVWA